jgi:hypothetical protein
MHVLSLMFPFRVNGGTAFCARTRRQKHMSGGAEGSTAAASIPNPREVGAPIASYSPEVFVIMRWFPLSRALADIESSGIGATTLSARSPQNTETLTGLQRLGPAMASSRVGCAQLRSGRRIDDFRIRKLGKKR